MEEKKSKSLHYYMRSLHRDLGYLVFGLMVIYALSGTILLYRNTDFMKKEAVVERQLKPGLSDEELGREMRVREFKVTKTEGDVVYFQNGTYNKASGMAQYKQKDVIFPFNKFINFHKSISSNKMHWFNLVIGFIFLFLAVSSLWMFKPKTKTFKRGMILTGIGIVVSILILLL